jgi:hypothetical protein
MFYIRSVGNDQLNFLLILLTQRGLCCQDGWYGIGYNQEFYGMIYQ